jgi:hypothetical protein
VCHVSLPSSYRSRRGHIHLLRVLPLVGCRSKTPTVGPVCQRQTKSPAVNALGARGSPRSINRERGRGESLTSSLSIRCPCPCFSFPAEHLLVFAPVRFVLAPPLPLPSGFHLQWFRLNPLSWPRSMVTPFALNELVNGGLLAPNVEGAPPAWIISPASDREPNPPYG